ncbi:MAG: signal peptidase I [Candidatus Izemoplasmatales bacterium]
MKKIVKTIYFIIPFVFIALAMAMMIHLGISLKNNEIPSVFNRAILYVKTPSMEPVIMTGDIIVIDTNETEFSEHDIISFKKPGEPNIIITHRIEKIDGDLITTKGVNNYESESWEKNFSKDLIVGKYVAKSSLLGSIYEVIFINSVDFLYVFIIIVFMLIGIIEIKSIVKLLTMKKIQEQEEEKKKMIEEAKLRLKKETKDEE